MRYFAILEKEQNSLWSLYFPDFPGCTSAGSTAEETIEGASEALHLYVREMRQAKETVPEPKKFEEVEALAHQNCGEVKFSLVGIPLIERDETQSVRVNITLNPAILRAIDAAAKRMATSRSAFLEQAATEKILHSA